MTVHDLRKAWKPHKERLAIVRKDHPTNIRFHRACSWLKRAEELEDGQDLDVVLTCRWIAFNALYGQWNGEKHEPKPDRECWRRFTDRALKLDTGDRVRDMLAADKKLVMAILDDSYLESFFWRDPSTQRAVQTTRDKRQASMWFVDGRWSLIIEALLDRIYLLRCQLVHGAATYGSKLNRGSLRRCCIMLDHLLTAVMNVIIDCGADEDWGPMCYPPVGQG